MTAGGAVSADVYYAKSTNNKLSIELIPANGTTIKTITARSTTVAGINEVNLITGTAWDNNSGGSATINDNKGLFTHDIWSGISVDFTQNGILEYIPNKDTLNPNHP